MSEEARKSTENGEDKRASVGKTKIKYSDLVLPMTKIRKVMMMDPNICNSISQEANYLMCAATEMFVKHVTKEVYEMDTKALSYKNLAKFVQDTEKLDFLHQIIPNKCTVREAKKKFIEVIEKEKRLAEESGSDISESSEEEEEEEEESEEDSVQEISDSEDEPKPK